MIDLPKGWAESPLSDIVAARKGKKPGILYKTQRKYSVPYLDIMAIEKGKVTSYAEAASSRLSNSENLLVVWDGARCGWVGLGSEGAIGSTIMALLPKIGERKFLYRWLQSQFDTINKNPRGTGIPHVDPAVFWSLEVPIAPLNEQCRIVAKIEKLLHKVDACKERLDKIPGILKRFRLSVLATACSGRLTEDWRKAPSHEKQKKPSPAASRLPLPEGEGDELPKSWHWRSLQDACDQIVDCPHSTPKWSSTGHLCVRTTNFKPGFLDLSERRYVSDKTFTERIQRLRPRAGDLLYSREGGILGIACMVPVDTELCLGQRMMLFRTNTDCRPEMLMHWLNSPKIFNRVKELTGGSASPHLNVKDIKNFPVPLPPLPEQHEIVRRVEVLFKKADEIEARYKKAKAFVDKLTQSILAKAFRGELVPQDPNDEPASVLLERIRAERENQQKKPATGRNSKKKYALGAEKISLSAENKGVYGRSPRKKH